MFLHDENAAVALVVFVEQKLVLSVLDALALIYKVCLIYVEHVGMFALIPISQPFLGHIAHATRFSKCKCKISKVLAKIEVYSQTLFIETFFFDKKNGSRLTMIQIILSKFLLTRVDYIVFFALAYLSLACK